MIVLLEQFNPCELIKLSHEYRTFASFVIPKLIYVIKPLSNILKF